MGKTKQQQQQQQQTAGKAKKFDRNVEISAPILDPEVIRAIHSPPKDKKLDIRHGGFKALLSDLNSQDSTDELTPITENHLPSYIGISCAVSGYSNYSSYVNRRPLDDLNSGNEIKSARLTTNSSRLSTTPSNRSHTSSPSGKRNNEQAPITHVTIDRNNISSPDQERKELTEKLTASATERRRAPSPLPPIEDGRHHGAYVGARYFPMPEPSKQVHKHIPLLGIDDDQDPDEFVAEDPNKMEKKIANLYGDEFVEDWKESMSHKAKKEGHQADGSEQQAGAVAVKNLKDLVTLKPTPQKTPEPTSEPVDVPTPNVSVLAGVEKQFLNKLLTDENPPMPRSPSPLPVSPPSTPRHGRPVMSPSSPTNAMHAPTTTEGSSRGPAPGSPPPVASSPLRSPTPQAAAPPSPPVAQKSPSPRSSPGPSPTKSPVASPSPVTGAQDDDLIHKDERESPVGRLPQAQAQAQPSPKASPVPADSPRNSPMRRDSPVSPISLNTTPAAELVGLAEQAPILEEAEPVLEDEIISLDEQLNATLGEHISPVSPSSPDSVRSSSTVEDAKTRSAAAVEASADAAAEAAAEAAAAAAAAEEQKEQHIECEIRTQTPVDNESSPVKALESEPPVAEAPDARLAKTEEHTDLVSFSPEPTEANNNQNSAAQVADETDLIKTDDTHDSAELGRGSEILQPDLATQALEAQQQQQQPQPQPQPSQSQESTAMAGASESGEVVVRDGRYFLSILEKEESFIMDQAKSAEARLAEHESDWDEETIGKVRSAIGKAHLLINKKCNQFRQLCEQSLVNDASDQYAVLNDDLAGFWDMISIQIADVRKSFENLGA